MEDEATVDGNFDVMIEDIDVVFELFAGIDDVFDVVVEVFVVDGMCFGAPFGAGAPLTTKSWKSIQKPNMAAAVKRFMALEGACDEKEMVWWDISLFL